MAELIEDCKEEAAMELEKLEESYELKVGDRVVVDSDKKGQIRWIGEERVLGAGVHYGIRLAEKRGTNGGTVKGRDLFWCPPGFGLLVARTRITHLYKGDDFDFSAECKPQSPSEIKIEAIRAEKKIKRDSKILAKLSKKQKQAALADMTSTEDMVSPSEDPSLGFSADLFAEEDKPKRKAGPSSISVTAPKSARKGSVSKKKKKKKGTGTPVKKGKKARALASPVPVKVRGSDHKKTRSRGLIKPGETLYTTLTVRNSDKVDVKKVKAIVKRFPTELNSTDPQKNNALHLAALRPDADVLKFLLSKTRQKHIDATNNQGNTPFLCAATVSVDIPCIHLFLQHKFKSDLNAKNIWGRTALIHACFAGMDEVALLLISKSPPVDLDISDKSRKPPLYFALGRGNVKVSRALLKAGATAKFRDSGGRGAIDIVKGQACKKLLLEFGVKPGKKRRKEAVIMLPVSTSTDALPELRKTRRSAHSKMGSATSKRDAFRSTTKKSPSMARSKSSTRTRHMSATSREFGSGLARVRFGESASSGKRESMERRDLTAARKKLVADKKRRKRVKHTHSALSDMGRLPISPLGAMSAKSASPASSVSPGASPGVSPGVGSMMSTDSLASMLNDIELEDEKGSGAEVISEVDEEQEERIRRHQRTPSIVRRHSIGEGTRTVLTASSMTSKKKKKAMKGQPPMDDSLAGARSMGMAPLKKKSRKVLDDYDADEYSIASPATSPKARKRKPKRKKEAVAGTYAHRVVVMPGENILTILKDVEGPIDFRKLKALLKRFPKEIELRDSNKNTCLHLAAQRPDAEVLTYLLEKVHQRRYYDLFRIPNFFGNTAFMAAAVDSADLECTRLLLKAQYPSNLNHVNVYGRTALIHAAFHRDKKMIQLLLEHRPPPAINIKDKSDKTALFWAANRGLVLATASMLILGGDPTIQSQGAKDSYDVASGQVEDVLLGKDLATARKYWTGLGQSVMVSKYHFPPSVLFQISDFADGVPFFRRPKPKSTRRKKKAVV